MKRLGSFFLWFLGVLAVVMSSLMIYTTITNSRVTGEIVASPLPQFFNSVFPKNASASEFWQPNTSKTTSFDFKPTALSALSYDTTTNTLLFGKKIDERLPMASLTKIMTAIIAIEELDINSEVIVSKEASEIGESSMGLSENERVKLKDLLYGLILHSGNDAAEAIAETSKFGKEGFVYLMNKKAEDLGLTHTRFTNASGLQGDGEQYSTARELLILTRYAMKNPTFAEIVATYEHNIPETNDHKAFTLYNETNLLTTYPGVKGVKTGFTDEAGMCLVTYLDYQGHQIIAVLLNSENRRQEMKDLLDYSLLQLGVTPPPHI